MDLRPSLSFIQSSWCKKPLMSSWSIFLEPAITIYGSYIWTSFFNIRQNRRSACESSDSRTEWLLATVYSRVWCPLKSINSFWSTFFSMKWIGLHKLKNHTRKLNHSDVKVTKTFLQIEKKYEWHETWWPGGKLTAPTPSPNNQQIKRWVQKVKILYDELCPCSRRP